MTCYFMGDVPDGVPVPVVTLLVTLVLVVAALIVWAVHLHRRIRKLEIRCLIDPLTGVANREAAVAAIEAACQVDNGLQLAFIDVDRFKEINDLGGHTAGDVALVAVASRLREAVAAGDVVARVGGDEFVVLAKDEAVLTALRRTLARGLSVGEGVPVVTASMGWVRVAAFMSALTALQGADDEMYEAKRLRKLARAMAETSEHRVVPSEAMSGEGSEGEHVDDDGAEPAVGFAATGSA